MPEQQPLSIATETERSSDIHQTPFYVFPTLEGSKLLTLPGGVLIRGARNAVTSSERNANAIAERHGLTTKARGSLVAAEAVNAYGFIVEPAWKTTVPEYADFSQGADQTPHKFPLELHDHTALLARIEAEIKTIEEVKEKSDQPRNPFQQAALENLQKSRHLDSVLIRAFGSFLLHHH